MTLNVKGGEETRECHREYACTLRNLGSRYEEEKNGNGETKREKKREKKHVVADVSLGSIERQLFDETDRIPV